MIPFRYLLITLVSLSLSCGPIFSNAVHAESRDARVILLFDVSGSFKKFHEKAWDRIDRDMKRFRRSGDDLVIIRLDGKPEIVFDGKMELIKKARTEFSALSQLSNGCCTDVSGALNLAAFRLSQAPVPAHKIVWIVSDMIHEPKGRPVLPPEDSINWDGLKGAEVRIYFIPPAQAMTWSAIFQKHGLTAEFFNPAQSENITIEESRSTPVSSVQGSFMLGLAKLVGYFLVALIGLRMIPGLYRTIIARIQTRRETR